MKHTVPLVVALLVLAGGVVPSMVAAQPAQKSAALDGSAIVAQTEDNETATNATNDTNATNHTNATNATNASENATVSPGAMLSGVIGVQHAEINGAVEQRAFGLRVAAAASNGSIAQVIDETEQNLQARLSSLRAELQRLREARRNGSISEATYRAEVSELAARIQNVRALANSSARTAQHLPADVLQEHGVNVSAIRTLKMHAANLTGPEVAEIARSIAGPDIGKPVGPPEGVPGGPPEWVPGGPSDGMPGERGMNASGNQTDHPGPARDGNDSDRPGAMNRTNASDSGGQPGSGSGSHADGQDGNESDGPADGNESDQQAKRGER
ncbi:MAG: hypothetical protein ABEI31_03690 [Halodesulfurarchaeum sp.]